jgi:hypothetical protein
VALAAPHPRCKSNATVRRGRKSRARRSLLALYLNVFVAVVQAFQKLSPLAALAPTQSEPPFLVVIAIFIVLGVVAVKRFHA